MEELITLVKQNNAMLQFICQYLINNQESDNVIDFMSNVAANFYTDTLLKK